MQLSGQENLTSFDLPVIDFHSVSQADTDANQVNESITGVVKLLIADDTDHWFLDCIMHAMLFFGTSSPPELLFFRSSSADRQETINICESCPVPFLKLGEGCELKQKDGVSL